MKRELMIALALANATMGGDEANKTHFLSSFLT